MGWAQRENKDKPKTVGSWRIKDPKKLIKLGLVIDAYKLPFLQDLWEASEKKAKEQLPAFDPSLRFFQENKTQADGRVIYSFRWYTPADNREVLEGVN